jgi:hypothetical protein
MAAGVHSEFISLKTVASLYMLNTKLMGKKESN